MGKKLEQIFNECIERMLQGESIESCLKSYPKEADKLEPLLRTAFAVNRKAYSFEPNPQFKAVARARLEGALHYAQQKPVKTKSFTLHRALAPALATILILLFGSVGTAAASSDSMPDETLYPVKLATEQVKLTLTFSGVEKAKLNVQMAENRAQEIVVMAAEGNTEQITIVTEKLVDQMEKTSIAIEKVATAEIKKAIPAPEIAEPEVAEPEAPERSLLAPQESIPATGSIPTPDATKSGETNDAAVPEVTQVAAKKSEQLKKVFVESISKNVIVLENALDKVPEPAKQALVQAIEVSRKGHNRAQQIIINPNKNNPGAANDGPTTSSDNITGTTDNNENSPTNKRPVIRVPSDNTTENSRIREKIQGDGNEPTPVKKRPPKIRSNTDNNTSNDTVRITIQDDDSGDEK